jgi:hypothetical protein
MRLLNDYLDTAEEKTTLILMWDPITIRLEGRKTKYTADVVRNQILTTKYSGVPPYNHLRLFGRHAMPILDDLHGNLMSALDNNGVERYQMLFRGRRGTRVVVENSFVK